ncbi:STAS/SEC14 domain-containing protein [Polyangium jinanense]|uniref:STAS/SEC14 domain-containing protein n=1 Tax=Polyangium jinanense TaxID=2829994 RepID=A0A9X3X1K2_9BACT|nr:STAS/SEC14 domain-containing protein [Polyangium jinanense]MDC3954010.1 STAS/SEC14 domain-containing protein [Polyangium jinanense]MDC3957777.1 STAS/SEC14 domain-containing protein [Polyangium jinanense]MDC3978863.1 STAS/SEC14 domain-containing protein [Polyangium jinanense]MDC3982034.1 STAS/SEC14 domain-containing protein [Polyangium jinanense]
MRPDLPTNDFGSEGWYRTGGHTYRCEDAGILFIRTGGDLAEDHVAALFDAFAWLCDERGHSHVFWLIDIGRLGAVLPGARTRAATTPVRPENKGMVLFNGSFRQRVVVKLVDKATSLLQPNTPPLVFSSTEAEARAWIDERRRVLTMRESQ